MARYTRRQFLEDSVLAAAVAAGAAGPQPVGGREAQEQAEEESRRLVARGHRRRRRPRQRHTSTQYLANPNTEIAYIVDVDETHGQKKAAAVAKKQGARPKVARDLRVALDDKSVHIVSCATPNHWHALCAIWAMQAGKDVYVEKPVSHNVSEGRRIVETARKHNRICQAGTQCRSMRGTIEAIEYVQAGKIGEVKLARGLCYKRRDFDRPQGQVHGAAGSGLQPLVRPGADAAR